MIDIWSKGEVFNYLKFLQEHGQIRPCTKLKLEKGHFNAFYPRCVEDWASRSHATNVYIDCTAYSGPSSYFWPVCPENCPGFVETKELATTLFSEEIKPPRINDRVNVHTFEFDFSISFAGNHRSEAECLAQMLSKENASVFYYEYYRSQLLGKKLGLEFQKVYGPRTRFFVPLVSKEYISKYWPRYELDVAMQEAKRRDKEFILPLALDDSRLPGIDDDVAYIDLRKTDIKEVAEILLNKLPSKPVVKERAKEVWVSSFGLVIAEVLESDNLPIGAPRDYVYLCDWLEEDLKTRLESVPIGPFIFTEPSSRDGECLSVRIAFKWSPHNQPLDFGNLCWWQVTEVGPFKEFYPYQEPEKLFLNLRDCT
ncbi:MAG: hypothetical protein A3C38_05215 [Planctomycetes bacterium RIFCSPHIGHO2_02_FULL_50_42]|nr:MAG: hypothetical protein A3C38_05215 [Planctomycetes bacterium RIFCSPHIGHO2_02_FULL_50_42]OHB94994.1 MAG: hypothetical protein A3I59_04960 [Planctomycetes bacterium RIFCSPLOWO2_02_FULL_50_16]HCN19203.1 hypothetical protein [Planctomycetia bacterium]